MRGTVLELIQRARISLALKYKLMLDTASAVDFLHSNGVLYRDLKPDNLLVFSVSHNAGVNCKLSDFGTSRIVDDPKVPMQHTSGIGTPIYMAARDDATCTRSACSAGSWWPRSSRSTR